MAAQENGDSVLSFDSYCAAEEYIQTFEVENHCRFVKRDTRNHLLNSISSIEKRRIRFEDMRGEIPIGMDGVPFVTLGSEVRECQYGPDRSRPKIKIDDHQYADKSRKITQHTKKQNCPAQIRMRFLIRFPDYEIAKDSTGWRRKVISMSLKENFHPETTRQKYQVFVKIENCHTDHLQGELSDFCQPLDKRVISKIHALVEAGCHSVPQIQKDVEMFVRSDLGVGEDESTNRRFFPRPQDIRNHLYYALKLSRCSEDDQTRVTSMVDMWKSKYPKDKFFFRPASVNQNGDDESFLFVHQTEFQQRLLQMYGADVVILDSTYKTSKYDIPLFLLSLLTNVGYHVVGLFLIGRETTLQIKGALQMLSSWNPSWSPTHFMTDLDHREITAIEETFTGTSVLTCEFHREQAWRRWLQRNGLSKDMTEMLHQLRSIAGCETEEAFKAEVERLKTGDQYLTNASFRNWIDKYWIAEKKRWVSCYINLPVRVTTTNGVEALNRVLKDNYLRHNNLKTLSSMLTVLIEKFIPANLNRYKEKNITSHESHRRYTEDVPHFLRNRPKPFLDHCLKKLRHDSIEAIQENEVGFSVKSADSGNIYQVTLNPNVHCSCPDWKKFHWPCKHILHVIVKQPGVEWDTLPVSYTGQPWFLLDTSFGELPENPSKEQNPSQPCSATDDSERDAAFETEPVQNSSHESTEQILITETENSQPVQTENPGAQRKLCLETIKNIQNSVYNVDNEEILTRVHKSLVEIETLLDKNTPKLCNLPLWNKRGRKKYGFLKRTNSSTYRSTTFPKKVRSGPSSVITDARDGILQCGKPPVQCIGAVRQIWQSDADGGRLIGRVGPYNIRDSSVKFMQSTLSDEIIDAYLHVMTDGKTDVYHINCITMTSIFTGTNCHGLLQHVDLLRYQTVIGAVNEGGCHWTLMIIRPHEKKLLYMNPLGELHLSEQRLLQHWYSFLRERFVANLGDRASAWTISSPPHARQSDSTSCGLYVIKLAECYLLGLSLLFVWSKEQIAQIRENAAAFLIWKAARLPDFEVVSPPGDEDYSTILANDSICRLSTDEIVSAKPTNENNAPMYNLRKIKEKRLSSSFIYPPIKKARKKSNDMKNDIDTESSIKTTESSVKKFLDKFCDQDDYEGTSPEANYFIDAELAASHMKDATSRVQAIISGSLRKNNPLMKRHNQFKQDWMKVQKKGYGVALFSPEAILFISHYLKEKFYTDKKAGKPFNLHGAIKGLTDVGLKNLFEERREQADNYLEHVLVPEAMAYIFQLATSVEYEVANKECGQCEHTSAKHARLEGARLCYSKKQFWLKKSNSV